jgi:hypothetical protein
VYLLTKSFISILILKIAVVIAIIWLVINNKYKSKTYFYLFVCVLVYGCLALLLAQILNIIAITQPHIVQEAAQVTTQQKVSSYNSFVLQVYLIPLVMSMICFWIYNKSVDSIEIVKKKKKINWKKELKFTKFLWWDRIWK